jgi:hypothetical protein
MKLLFNRVRTQLAGKVPFPARKLQQLYRLVRESHAHPLTGEPQKPVLVGPEQLGITFIGHSSFLIQIAAITC